MHPHVQNIFMTLILIYILIPGHLHLNRFLHLQQNLHLNLYQILHLLPLLYLNPLIPCKQDLKLVPCIPNHSWIISFSPLHAVLCIHFILSFKRLKWSCYTKNVCDSRWRDAMGQEFSTLQLNGTWTLCPRPLNHNVIQSKWVFKRKQKQDGSIDRFKARLVVKGFEQHNG